ncbi:AfsR/SARP family transcriptional regulator [Streptomyces fructofermentans]|uniref:AfsR/SARP family transcriptional regulator n=1 Tax=Streptomyces fructofermentans TaxID=152141 RepID=UPI00340F4BA2
MSATPDAPSPAAGLTFEVLGEVRCWRDGVELPLGAPRMRAVLAVLVLRAGTPVGRDVLVDGVWGDAPVADGVNLVQAYVSKLRRLLEPDRPPRSPTGVLTRIGSSYRLVAAPGASDLGRFHHARAEARELRAAGRAAAAERVLAEALGNWRCPPLTGVGGPLLDAERVRLAELRLAAVEEQTAVALEVGAHADVVPALMSLTAEHPYRERLWELLMVALYRCSRQGDALAAYRRAGQVLLDDLGLEPGPGLRRVHEAILAGAAVAGAPDGPAAVPPGRPPLTLVGGGRRDPSAPLPARSLTRIP